MQKEAALSVVEEGSNYHSNDSNCAFSQQSSCGSINQQQQKQHLTFLNHTHDVGSRYLHGRQNELKQLNEACQRRLQPNPESELILISGKAGTGKTTLATTIRDDIVNNKNGYFIVGKYDQLQRPEPYATIVSAFTDFVRMVIDTDEENMKQIKQAIIKSIGVEDIGILINMLPAIEQILYPSGLSSLRSTATIRGTDAHTRIKMTFRNFVRGICSPQRPIVLLMDDLQWADVASLDLLEIIVADNKNQGLVVLGVCRSNEVSYNHDFAAMLRNLEDEKNTIVTNIEVKNLTFETTNAFVADVLKLSSEICQPFSEAVYSKTHGNVYFLLHLLQSLYEDGILKFEATGIYSQWVWDQNDLDNYQKDISIIDLVSNKIQRLPSSTQLVLKTAACIGAEFEEYILSTVLEQNVDVATDLSIAVDSGMIIPNINGRHNVYAFSHDRIGQASYALIADDEKDRMHLSIGELLIDNLSSEEMEMYFFLVVDQLSRGASLLKKQTAKDSLAALCLQAGEKSILSGDFNMASNYFWRGIDMLGQRDRHWKDQYILSLNLYNAAAEAEYCVPNFEKVDHAVGEVLERARTFRDRARAFATQVYALGARGMIHEAIDIGLFVLHGLGQPLPANPNQANIILDIAKTELMLRGKTNRYILCLPDVVSPEIVEAMSILNLITTYAHLGNRKIFPFIACRLVRLSLKYGLCAISAFGFVAYGLVCCNLGKFESGYRWGELALSILERYNATEAQWVPRVYGPFYGMIAYLKRPMHSLLDKVWYGYQAGLATGDIEYAMIGIHCYAKYAFLTGKPLPVLESQLMTYTEKIESYKGGHNCGPLHALTKVMHQAVHNLMGHNSTLNNRTKLTGEVMDHDKVLEMANDKKVVNLLANIMFFTMILAYHLNDMELAVDMAQKSRRGEKTQVIASIRNFYDGMTSFAAAASDERSMQKLKRKHISAARKNMNKIRKVASMCGNDFKHKWLLLKAENESLKKGNIKQAMEYYNQSIHLACAEGFLQDQALACERTGLYLLRHNDNNSSNASCALAAPYLKRALILYEEWGATAKVDQMIRQHENIDFNCESTSGVVVSSLESDKSCRVSFPLAA